MLHIREIAIPGIYLADLFFGQLGMKDTSQITKA
jgi:hypothetical protein